MIRRFADLAVRRWRHQARRQDRGRPALTEQQRRRFEEARNHRTDDPMVGRVARWAGRTDHAAAVARIPVGAVGTVSSWQFNGAERLFSIDFDFDGGGATWLTTLPDPSIELL